MSVHTGVNVETYSFRAVVLNLVENKIFCGPFKCGFSDPTPR